MVDMDKIIIDNISKILKTQGKSYTDLAKQLGIDEKTMKQIIDGIKGIDAKQLQKIASYLNIDIKELSKIPTDFKELSFKSLFGDKVKSEGGKQALNIADELSDMILFHAKVRNNGEKMMTPMDSDI